ncbi:transposase [Escherichia coli]|nr:transposase [Escherichia coli]
MVRNSLRFVTWKDYKAVTRDLKQVYRAATEEGVLQALDAFGKEWEGMGCTVPADKSQLAGKLTECCHLLRVPGGDPKGYLHH